MSGAPQWPEILGLYRRFVRLHAESAGLEFNRDFARIKEIAAESEELRKRLDLRPMPTSDLKVGGLYWGHEELCAVWTTGAEDHWAFTRLVIDFIARELDVLTMIDVHNVLGLAHAFGPMIVDQVFDMVEQSLPSFRGEVRRKELTVEDDEDGTERLIVATLDDDSDDRPDEAPFTLCAPGEEAATLIDIIDLDKDAFTAIGELIEERDRMARRALRGAPFPDV
ncbi:hypothetical protein [Novosphingobium mangrovi (ex Huang et al. 2023)]|uniref:Uncharacterized protein n=1 Tax=Novosphingobium mangrovi (ex Huang et al. 2023) TaxID=2976432 RepID=A0ABT2I106_9SPHN|nr:hypothetical protein [Novosphingobium mangrovi (ex Huang et al. 2023)]MCT2398489.1 hypothetical protein [Novosphingobium mangrovi (ex Huang et al. 2023)]